MYVAFPSRARDFRCIRGISEICVHTYHIRVLRMWRFSVKSWFSLCTILSYTFVITPWTCWYRGTFLFLGLTHFIFVLSR